MFMRLALLPLMAQNILHLEPEGGEAKARKFAVVGAMFAGLLTRLPIPALLGSLTRGVLTSRLHSCWKKLRWRSRLVWVSWTGCTPATPGAANRLPATKSMPMVRTLRAASNATPRTYHGLPMPRAASNRWFCINGLLLPLLNAAPCRHSARPDCRVL